MYGWTRDSSKLSTTRVLSYSLGRVYACLFAGFTTSGCMLSSVGQEQKPVRKDITYRRGAALGMQISAPRSLLFAFARCCTPRLCMNDRSTVAAVPRSFPFLFFSLDLAHRLRLNLNLKDVGIGDCIPRNLSMNEEKELLRREGRTRDAIILSTRLIVVEGEGTRDTEHRLLLDDNIYAIIHRGNIITRSRTFNPVLRQTKKA